MNLYEYMKFTRETVIYPDALAVEYCTLGLVSEAGEVAGKVKKEIRDNLPLTEEIKAELGDVLWYWVRLCDEYGFYPDEIIFENVRKLKDRKERNKLSGSGDER